MHYAAGWPSPHDPDLRACLDGPLLLNRRERDELEVSKSELALPSDSG